VDFTREIDCKCSSCGKASKVSQWGSINVSQDPSLKDKVKDGSLFVWECPHCGARNLSLYDTLYHDPEHRLMIWLDAAGSSREEDMQSLAAHLEDYTLRKVSDVGSLVEKVNIFDAGLEDTAMEVCKYIAKMELAQKETGQKASQIMSSSFKFYRLQGADGSIMFSFPLPSGMQGVEVGFSVYEDCRAILARNDIKASEGFAVVDSNWVGKYFK